MRRLIVTSSVYRQASRTTTPHWDDATRTATQRHWQQARNVDAANRLWWKYPRRRLTAEMLRDALLAVGDGLNFSGGGPGIMQPLPAEVTATLLANQWKVSKNPADHQRRSIYLFARRNLRDPLFDAFDRPDANQTCPARNQSVTPTQSLELFNSRFTWRAAQRLATAITREGKSASSSAMVESAFQRVYGRLPNLDEQSTAIAFLGRGEAAGIKWPATPDNPAFLTEFCLALLNSSEFLVFD